MTTLLHVLVSPRGTHSISRALSEIFVRSWQVANPGGVVIKRDLASDPVPYIDMDWIAGVYAPPTVKRTDAMRAALDRSAMLIDELRAADDVLISTPMYHFTVPAVLKSWIDYVVRPGFTFALGPGWPGLLADRPVRLLVATRDDYDPGSEDDLVTPVVRRAFAFMGVRDVRSLLAGGSLGVNRGEVTLSEHLARFEQPIAAFAQD